MMGAVGDRTLFLGEIVRDKFYEFTSNLNNKMKTRSKILFESPEHSCNKFILQFDDGTECGGIAVEENGLLKSVYIYGTAEAGTFGLD